MTKERTKLDRAFSDIFEELMKGKHTINIGEVTAFQKTKPPKASVQIVLKRLFEGEDGARQIAILDDCPIIYPGAGDWWLTFDLKVGSNVLILYNERSIADWLDQGGIIEPSKTRTFNESDAIVIAGILPDPDNFDEIDGDCIALRKKDNSLFLKLFNDGITARLKDMDLEITDDIVKAKPTKALISTDVKIYNHVGHPPLNIGYVSLLNHIHIVNVPGAVTEKPTVTEPGPP